MSRIKSFLISTSIITAFLLYGSNGTMIGKVLNNRFCQLDIDLDVAWDSTFCNIYLKECRSYTHLSHVFSDEVNR